ncbi:DUF6531 domain-containing protein [Catenulispora yoronensis]|uniref:DUF6531 domain-containing protein n=1 Tax=Catenulispora yoronensis TaxID=450799 RepID=UPI0031E3F722
MANDLAPFLDVLALATSWIPGVDVITAGLAEADNLIALAGTGMQIVGDGMQGHWGDALMGAGMLGATFLGGKAISKLGGKAFESMSSKFGKEAEGAENAAGARARTAEGSRDAQTDRDPVDVVSGWMLTDAVDVDLPGVLPLVLRRAYASGYSAGRLFGPGWSSTLDQRLSINEFGIHFAGDDAQRLDYPIPAYGIEVLPQRGSRWPLVWDRQTDEIQISDAWSGRTYHFSTVHYRVSAGQIRDLTEISDRNGNRIRIMRDAYGNPHSVEHAGYRVAVETSPTVAGPRIAALRLLDGSASGVMLRRFEYDDRGRLVGVRNSSDVPFCYEWDEQDRIAAWQDRSGYRYSYHYDHLDRVIRGEGEFLSGTFVYDPDNRTTVAIDSLGHKTTYQYDEYGHVCAETDPLGNASRTQTDRYGRVLVRIDAVGGTTRYEYDDAGDVRRVVASDGAATTFDYDLWHRVVAGTAPDGATWRRQYDDCGNVVAVVDPASTVSTFEYSDGGALVAVSDPSGAVTRFSVDRAGLPVAWIDPAGGVTRMARDAAGRVVRIIDPLGAVTSYGWSAEGRPESRTDPDGATTRWRHNADGRLIEAVEPTGATTVFEPGPMNLLVARTGPDGIRHAFLYDRELRLLEVATSAGATWSYAYDAAGRLTREVDYIGRVLGYEYDRAGRLTARATGISQQITFDYDAAGRMTGRRTAEGEFAYCYDLVGRLTSATGPDSRIDFQYDALGQLLAETVDGRTVSYTYNDAGQRVRRVTASGAESTWTFDEAGRPVGLAAGAGRLTVDYDVSGQETQRVIGGLARLSREYDAVGRVVSQSLLAGSGTAGDVGSSRSGASVITGTQTLLSRSWTWRADGVPEEIRDSLRGTRRIVSDVAGRVTAVNGRDWSEAYAYDAFGNLLQDRVGAAPTNSETDDATVAARTLIRRAGRTHYEYDDAGRLISAVRRTLDGRRKIWNYTWDSQDRLVRAETPDSGTWSYSYDALGRRTGKRRIGGDGLPIEQVLFTWDGSRLAEQHSIALSGEHSTLTWDYDPGTFHPAAQRRRSWASDADQQLIDDEFHAIVTDLIGAPTELVALDGHIAWSTRTTVWGRIVGTDAEPGLDCPLGFPGQYCDAETGLRYNLNRYYNPDAGAYLTPDPLGLAPAPNDHAYVSNPLTSSDPFGLYEDKPGAGDDPAEKPLQLIYEANKKHRYKAYVNSRGQVVSRLPRGDAQEMLENSVRTKAKERIGTEPGTGLDVVFKLHLTQEHEDRIVEHWHGFVPED